MARLTLILGVLATVVYLLDGFRFVLNEWRRWRNKGTWLAVLLVLAPTQALAEDFYLAMTDLGAIDRSSCANASIYTWFNSAANWTGAGKIDPGDTVHLCGVFTGGNATNFLTFQGSGTAGNVVTVVFETGAEMRPNYCASSGCIDLNGKSYILINGGTACGNNGSVAGWTTTACNGKIQSWAIGSITKTCPNSSSCVAFSGSVAGVGTGTGNPSNIEVKNITFGPMYTRDAADTSAGGTGTIGMGVGGGALSHDVVFHHSVCTGMLKCYVVSLGTLVNDLGVYSMYNVTSSDQCWGFGLGGDGGNSWNMTTISIHDNKISDWNNWAASSSVCHGNGTMIFNGNDVDIHTPSGFVGTSDSRIYNNLLTGDLSGGIVASSPSGFISCQDNCTDIAIFNNIIVNTCTGSAPSRSCGTPLYFNGPGGGGQQVYNNTISGGAGDVLTATNIQGNAIFKNNIANMTISNGIGIRPNNSDLTSDYNDMLLGTSNWISWNTAAGPPTTKTLAQWQAAPYLQDLHSLTSDPLLDGSYKLTTASPAKGAGVDLSSLGITELLTDPAGLSRPSGSAWDIGAYQYAETSFIVRLLRLVEWAVVTISTSWVAFSECVSVVLGLGYKFRLPLYAGSTALWRLREPARTKLTTVSRQVALVTVMGFNHLTKPK